MADRSVRTALLKSRIPFPVLAITSYRPYGLAALAVAAFIPLALLIGAATGGPPPVVVLLVAVTFAAWVGGMGPALCATGLSVVAAYLFLRTGVTHAGYLGDVTRIAMIGLVGACISLIAGSMHRARAALRVEAARLKSFLEHLPAGVIIFDAEGRAVQSNESARKMLGYSSVPGLRGGWEVYDATDRKLEPGEFATTLALQGELVTGRELRQVRPDGTESWVSVSSAPIYEDGQIVGALTTCFDIEPQKRLQFELEESRRVLQLAHASSRSGSFDYDVRTRRTRWSPELELLYGFPPENAFRSYEEWAARVHPDDLARVEPEIAAAASVSGGKFSHEFRIFMPDGTIRHVHAQGRTWPGPDGQPAHMVGIGIDVTEAREAQARLRATEQRLEIALAAARMGHFHLDIASGKMECSATCKANFGRLPDERFDYPDLLSAIHPEDLPSMQGAVRHALEEKRDYAAEYRAIWPDGTVRWIAARGRTTFDAQGTPVAMDGVTMDFTGRKLLEEELRESTQSLREADQRKDQFLAVLGHELRNPLAPMRNAVALLDARGDDANVRARSVAVLQRQVAQLTHLVSDLLDISRIGQGKVRLEKQPARLADIVADAAEMSQPVVTRGNHELVVTVAPGDFWLDVDRARIVQVLTNLLNNASKYSEDGGLIELDASVTAGVAVIRVKDTGIGIAAEALEKIFEPFSQVEASLSRAAGGLGLGLNLARHLVEMHGGTIGVFSDGPGRGSTFTVTLPTGMAVGSPSSSVRTPDPAE